MTPSVPKFHPVATGDAEKTVNDHQAPADIIIWGGWFCPFSQRTWAALEEKGIKYQYKEVNPYLKETSFLAISPKGLTPGFESDGKPLHDSSIINEFLEDRFPNSPKLLPTDPHEKAKARLWIDYINKSVVPTWFRLLQAQPSEPERQAAALTDFTNALAGICKEKKGEYFFGDEISLVDLAIAPWAVRDFIARDFRGFKREDVEGWGEWANALEARNSVKATTSSQENYIEFNQTFIKNEGHSLAGSAAQSGRAIP